MLKKLNYILLTFVSLFLVFFCSSYLTNIHAFTTNPTPTTQYNVDDYDKILSLNLKNEVIQKDNYYKHHTKNKPQIVLMTIPNSNGESIDNYARDLLDNTRWQFGNHSLKNDILILFANNHGNDNVKISTGRGIEYTLNSTDCSNILGDNEDTLKSNDNAKINQGLQNVFNSVTKKVDKSYANISRSKAKNNLHKEEVISVVDWLFEGWGSVIIIFLIILSGLFSHHNNNVNNSGYYDGYRYNTYGIDDYSDGDDNSFGSSSGGFNGGGSSI